eukprot:jgi/Botrbrau1/9592/Bobra.106_2s0015.1
MQTALQRVRGVALSVPRGIRCFASVGTEVQADSDKGKVSGIPEDILSRKVVIYAPARAASQQGLAKTLGTVATRGVWRMEFETQPKWENPLIGWTSTGDAVENVARSALRFDSQDEAVAFCEKHGWKYTVVPPKLHVKGRMKRFAGYGDNFSVRRHGYPEGGLISELPKK